LSNTFPLKVTLSPSFSASMWLEVTTMGSVSFFSGGAAKDSPVVRTAMDAMTSKLFLKYRLDIIFHRDPAHVDISRDAEPLEIDLAAQQLERVRRPYLAFAGLPG